MSSSSSQYRRYAAKVLSPSFIFCCFRYVIMPLTGVMNCVFAYIYLSLNCKQPAICGTNLQLFQPAGIRLTHWQNVLKIHKYCRNYRAYFCPSAQDNSSSGVNNSSLRTQKGVFLGPDCDKTVHPRAKVTIVSLQEVVYEKLIGIKMNNLDFCLEVVWSHVNHCITFAIEYLGNR